MIALSALILVQLPAVMLMPAGRVPLPGSFASKSLGLTAGVHVEIGTTFSPCTLTRCSVML